MQDMAGCELVYDVICYITCSNLFSHVWYNTTHFEKICSGRRVEMSRLFLRRKLKELVFRSLLENRCSMFTFRQKWTVGRGNQSIQPDLFLDVPAPTGHCHCSLYKECFTVNLLKFSPLKSFTAKNDFSKMFSISGGFFSFFLCFIQFFQVFLFSWCQSSNK